MASHHFIGNGRVSAALADAARDPELLTARISEMIHAAGLAVVADRTARFDNDGLTLVWVLAESHLVLHYWGDEGHATLDLHVCDYTTSNADKAERLVAELTDLCFIAGTARWRELHLEEPVEATAAAAG